MDEFPVVGTGVVGLLPLGDPNDTKEDKEQRAQSTLFLTPSNRPSRASDSRQSTFSCIGSISFSLTGTTLDLRGGLKVHGNLCICGSFFPIAVIGISFELVTTGCQLLSVQCS